MLYTKNQILKAIEIARQPVKKIVAGKVIYDRRKSAQEILNDIESNPKYL